MTSHFSGGVISVPTCRQEPLYVIGVSEQRIEPKSLRLDFRTTRGDFRAFYHTSPGLQKGVIFIHGPESSDGLSFFYEELADELLSQGIASLTVNCRMRNDCAQCSIDTLLALQYMDDEAVCDVVLVGWSFGGAVALSAASCARNVAGVVAISTFDISEQCVKRLSSKPMLLLHGEEDTVSPVSVSQRIHDEAVGPSEIIVYPNAGHDFTEVRDELRGDLLRWVGKTLAVAATRRHLTAKNGGL